MALSLALSMSMAWSLFGFNDIVVVIVTVIVNGSPGAGAPVALPNEGSFSKMADDQTEGMDRKILWASLYRDENRVNKLTLDFVFNDKVRNMLNASAAFLAGKKKFGKRTTLRPQAVYDEVARQVLADRGLKSPLGKIDGVPLSEYRP